MSQSSNQPGNVPSNIDQTLTALAEPNRRQIVDQLATGPQTPSQLAATLNLSGPGLSKHLKVLRQSGVVVAAADPNDARVRRYQLQEDRLLDLREWVTQLQQHWQGQLESFKQHVESSA